MGCVLSQQRRERNRLWRRRRTVSWQSAIQLTIRTAYRLWSGWRSHEDDEEDHNDDDMHGGETSKSEDRLVQSDHSEPPPAYDTIADGVSTIASSPAPSVTMSRRRRKRRIKRPSIAELIIATRQQELAMLSPPTRPSSTRASSPETSLPSPTFLSLTPGQTPHRSNKRAAPEPIEEEGESEDEEMSLRLDDMTRRIQNLINDGQRALHSQPTLPPADPMPLPLLSVTPNSATSSTSEGRPSSDLFSPWMDDGRTSRRSSLSGLARNRTSLPATLTPPTKKFARDGPRHSTPVPTASANTHSAGSSPYTHTRIPSYHGSPLSKSPRPGKPMPAPTLYGSGTAPPLPWRRERVGSNKWIQRPPSPTLGELASTDQRDQRSVGSSFGGSFEFGSLSSSDASHPGTPVHGTWSGSSRPKLAAPGTPLEPPAYLRPASPASHTPQASQPAPHTPARSRIPRFDHGRSGSVSSRPGSAASTHTHQRTDSMSRTSRLTTPATPKAKGRARAGTDGASSLQPHRSYLPSPNIKPGTVAQRRLSFTKPLSHDMK